YAPQEDSNDFIWGDKTPDHLNHMNLLKELYPEARLLHIIRDPRDYCLSMRTTWGKSLYRAADKWRRTLGVARNIGDQYGADYLEVLYESLLEKPAEVLGNICRFLGCKLVPDMISLAKPSEEYGAAKGQIRIVRENQQKYLTQLMPPQIQRIEEIVYPVADAIGYEFQYARALRQK
ncbi:TPA: sulfotransferase, partial [Candidatus Poribacteria bacterium]|nr:sulfotransferase [Candidatus Poribacteria bacterium]